MVESTSAGDSKVEFPFSLPKQEIIVTTDVDRLIDLLKKSREISVKDASEKLQVSLEIVESWVSFLEEEGIVSLTYKFTTPFISYLEHEEDEVVEVTPQEGRGGFFMFQDGDVGKKKNEAKSAKPVQTPAAKIHHPRPGEALVRPSDKQIEHPKLEPVVKPAPVHLEVNLPDEPDVTPPKVEPAVAQPKPEPVVKPAVTPPKAKPAVTPPDEPLVKPSVAPLEAKPAVIQSAVVKPNYGNFRTWIEDAYKFIQEGDLHQAQRSYSKVRSHFENIPLESQNERKEIEHHIIKLNRDLSLLMKEAALSYANELEAEITAKLRLLSKQLSKGKIKEAERDYAEVESLYDEFPAELVVRKLTLQMEILKHYRAIIIKKKKTIRHTAGQPALGSKKAEIQKLLSVVKGQLAKRHALAANASYQELNRVYGSLPKGFEAEKASLLLEIYDVHARLVPMLIEQLKKEFKHHAEKILRQLKLVGRYLAKDKLELARDMYREIVLEFNTLPTGFLEETTKLRVQLLSLYKELLIKSDVSLMEHLSRPAEQAYRAVLALLVNVHAHIENEEFEQIEPAYRQISKIVGQLPQERHKSRVREEVGKVAKMVELYNATKRLQGINLSQQDAVKAAMPPIKALYSSLLKDSPEDAMLYRYVYGVYSTYLAALKEGSALTRPKRSRKKLAPARKHVKAEPKKRPAEPKRPAETLEPEERQNLLLARPNEIYGRAVLYLNEEKFGQARECLDILLNKKPGDEQAKRLLSEINTLQSKQDLTNLLVKLKLDRAKHAVSAGDTDTARQNLREVLELDHTNGEAKMMLGELTGAAHRHSKRIEVLHPPLESGKPAVETPLPPSPTPGKPDALKEAKLQYTAGQRLKEAKLAISNDDYITAEGKLLDCLKLALKKTDINKEATDLLKGLRTRQFRK